MEIKLSNCDLSTTIDPEDLNRILNCAGKLYGQFRKGICSGVYFNTKTNDIKYGKIVMLPLTRLILNYEGFNIIDHIDRNPLNNKKDNLRLSTVSQNLMNRGKTKSITSSKYKGVAFWKTQNKWVARIAVNKIKILGGYFNNEIDAARKANELYNRYHGNFAVLNNIVEDK